MNVDVVKMFVEVMPMVLDFMTVAAFVLLCVYKLLLKLLSMSASVVTTYEKTANKVVNSDKKQLAVTLRFTF